MPRADATPPRVDKRIRRGRPSKILSHPNFTEIELALANGIEIKALAKKYGIHRSTLQRHKAAMPPERVALLRYRRAASPLDLDELKRSEAELVVQRNLVMMSELFQAWRMAAEAQDWRSAASLAAQHYKYSELQSKVVGELAQGDRIVNINIAEQPAYRRLVSLVMSWVQDRPAEAAELAAFLQRAEAIERRPMLTVEASDAAE